MAVGPSGWTRTTTSRVKSPACCVHTTEGMERMTGLEPVLQGLEGPRATVTPHSLWFGLRVSNPSLRAGNAGCFLHTQAEQTSVIRLSKNPLTSSWCPSADHPLVPPVLATAPGFEPGSASFGGSDAPVAPHCRSRRLSRRQNPPVTAPSLFSERPANKKGLLGGRPRRPGSQ